MRDIVLVPTYDRPEMLWLCLERLSEAEAFSEHEVRILVDNHFGAPPRLDEAVAVASQFGPVKVTVRQPHGYNGNSYNVLEGYKEALASDARFIYLVEDDVLVDPDFFLWHREAQAQGDAFCSIAAENTRSGQLASFQDYASLGVCFPRVSLMQVVNHAVPAYYENQAGYCQRMFHVEQTAKEDVEQDGLILRVMAAANGYSVWPRTPKATHIGWYGYHRPGQRPQGTLRERYEQVKERISIPVGA